MSFLGFVGAFKDVSQQVHILTNIFRSCIGQRFAKLELNVLMVKVIQNFRIEYDGEDVGIKTPSNQAVNLTKI